LENFAIRHDALRRWVDQRISTREVTPGEVYGAKIREALPRILSLPFDDLIDMVDQVMSGMFPVFNIASSESEHALIRKAAGKIDPDRLRIFAITGINLVWEYSLFGQPLVGGVPLSQASSEVICQFMPEIQEVASVFYSVYAEVIKPANQQSFHRFIEEPIHSASGPELRFWIRELSPMLPQGQGELLENVLTATGDLERVANLLVEKLRERMNTLEESLSDDRTIPSIREFEETDAVRIRPGAERHLNRGVEAIALRRWDEALVALRAAREADPDSAYIAVTLARALVELDRVEQASELVEFALDRQPSSPRIIENCCGYFVRTGQHARALALSSRLLELKPGSLAGHGLAFAASVGYQPALREAWLSLATSLGAGSAYNRLFDEDLSAFFRDIRDLHPIDSFVGKFLETSNLGDTTGLTLGLFGSSLACMAHQAFGNAEMLLFTAQSFSPFDRVLALWRVRNILGILGGFMHEAGSEQTVISMLQRSGRIIERTRDEGWLLALRKEVGELERRMQERGELLREYRSQIAPPSKVHREVRKLCQIGVLTSHLSVLARRFAEGGDARTAVFLSYPPWMEFQDEAVWKLATQNLKPFPKAIEILKQLSRDRYVIRRELVE
jgi:tetratricopeptide (TPR) repeat protein